MNKSSEDFLAELSVIRFLSSFNFFWVALAAAFSNILGLSTSLFILVVYDRILPNESVSSLNSLAIGVLIAVLFDVILKNAKLRIIEKASVNSELSLTETIFDRYVEESNKTDRRSIGALASVIRELEIYKEFLNTATIATLIDLPFSFLFIFVIYVIAGPIFLIPLLSLPIIIFLIFFGQPIFSKNALDLQSRSQSRQSILVEELGGLEAIKVNGAFKFMKKKFIKMSQLYSSASQKSKALSQINENIITVVQQVSQVAVIFYGFHLYVAQEITMGAIIASVILASRAIAPISKFGLTLSRASAAFAAKKNIVDFLSQKDRKISKGNTQGVTSSEAAVSINNATLRLSEYGSPLFNNLNIVISPREKVAIVGKSGAGKTSLLKVSAGLYELETGNVIIEGRDIRLYQKENTQETIGTVLQEPWLFEGSIRDNISVGLVNITDQDILDTFNTLLGTENFFKESASLDIQVNDRGSNLSGGQKQIIALVRSLINKPSVLFLDEPTSSMDTNLEGKVIQGLNTLWKEKTTLLITHKISLVKICDRVIVLEKGKIVWDGKTTDYLNIAKQHIKKAQSSKDL